MAEELRLGRAGEAIKGGLLRFLEGGAPIRRGLAGLLQGDVEPLKQAVGYGQPFPQLTPEQMRQQAFDVAMDINNPMQNVGGLLGSIARQSSPIWLDDLLSTGTKLNPDGTLTVYHATSKKAAEAIKKTKKMTGKEPALFFSSSPSGQITGYGDEVVKLKIPANKLNIDDIFDNEAHFSLPLKKAGDYLDVSKWIVD
jgi:hypothetical protein